MSGPNLNPGNTLSVTKSAIELPFLSPLAIADTASLRDGVIASYTLSVTRPLGYKT